ncbi:hypothetical protein R3P38DRAFT_935840 [Favolaschia claudopus]|uniref:Uncharacterized protein n=1 Tax=Favolaschia claudopus TaxID=2862362 RepID=A0AAV9YZ47_9AGAR
MSYTVHTLQNAFDLPSPVTFHFDDAEPDFDVDCPSPTSSVRGVFVRSRPNSMQLSEEEAASMSVDFAQFGMTGDLRVPFIHAAPPSRVAFHANATSYREEDTTTVRTSKTAASTRSSTPSMRLVRRAFTDDDDDASDTENSMPPAQPSSPAAKTPQRRTWPSMERLRGRVSGIFQRKRASSTTLTAPPPTPSDSTSDVSTSSTWGSVATPTSSDDDIIHITPSSRPRRTFSGFSLRTRARAATTASQSKRPVAHDVVDHLAIPRAKRVRRSRSFSGFTSMAQQMMLPPIADVDEPEVDEVGMEAYNVARGIGQFWKYEEDEMRGSLAVAGILERGVERHW